MNMSMSNSAIDSRQKLQSTYQFKSSSVFFLVLDAVLLVSFGRIVRLPARRWKDVLVPLVPTPQENFSCMRFVFFNAGIIDQSNIIVNVEAEQRSTFTPGLSTNQIFTFSFKFQGNRSWKTTSLKVIIWNSIMVYEIAFDGTLVTMKS